MAWVYILECSDGSLYVGSTTDVERRVWQHQNGEGAAYTKRRRVESRGVVYELGHGQRVVRV